MVHPVPHLPPEGLADPDDEGLDAAVPGEPHEQRSLIVDRGLHNGRIDKAVVTIAPEFSRNYLQTLIEQGHVRVGGKVVDKPSGKVQAGQRVVVEMVPTPESRAFRPEPIELSVVFEDDHLLILDKAPGMVVHPAAGNWSGTMLNGILHRHPSSAALPRAGIVHRLDKDTSGLMVVGKTLQAVTALVRSIAAREVHREYIAIANGSLYGETFTVDASLARDPQSRVKMAVLSQGRPARTDITPLAVARIGDAPAVTAVRCKLHTGRTHQIRVHMAFRRHPLVSDPLYGGRPALGLTRQALHAAKLGFAHPVTGEPLWFEAPPSADIADAWQQVLDEGEPAGA